MAENNVEYKVEGNTLTLKVDLSKSLGPSASGKTILVASTQGAVKLPGRDEQLNISVYRKKPK